jgi:hypothetical protein
MEFLTLPDLIPHKNPAVKVFEKASKILLKIFGPNARRVNFELPHTFGSNFR